MAQRMTRCPLASKSVDINVIQQSKENVKTTQIVVSNVKSTTLIDDRHKTMSIESFKHQSVSLTSMAVTKNVFAKQKEENHKTRNQHQPSAAPFAVFCDDAPAAHSSNENNAKSKENADEISDDLLSIFAYVKPKDAEERRPLAPLALNSMGVFQHKLDSVKTNSRELFDFSSENLDDTEKFDEASSPVFPSPRFDEESKETEDFYVPVKEVLTDKQIRLSLITCPPDFVQDIYEFERQQEVKLRPRQHYLYKQPYLTSNMRMILIDWMVDVAVEYQLEDETLHLAVNYVDRFLSAMVVDKDKLQLVGTTALLIASKYEEIYPPELKQFVSITDDSYTQKQVVKMEKYLLSVLQFQMAVPTVNFFVENFLRVSRSGQRCQCMAKYLAELCLLDVEFLNFVPSMLAASIVCLANLSTENIPWPVELEEMSKYSVTDFLDCMSRVLDALKCASELPVQAVFDKYKENKYCQVALMEAPESLPGL